MKIKLLVLLMAFASSCIAQQRIASLKEMDTIKVNSQQYLVKKTGKYVQIENKMNVLSTAKPYSSSTAPLNLELIRDRVRLDVGRLEAICNKFISLKEIQTMSAIQTAGLMINIRTDLKGNILEVSFLTDENSILTIQQIEQMEKEIKNTKLLTLMPNADKAVKGSNFLFFDRTMFYRQLLKTRL